MRGDVREFTRWSIVGKTTPEGEKWTEHESLMALRYGRKTKKSAQLGLTPLELEHLGWEVKKFKITVEEL